MAVGKFTAGWLRHQDRQRRRRGLGAKDLQEKEVVLLAVI
jgi:hypothetical protein